MRNCENCGFRKWIKPDREHNQWTWSHGHRVRKWKCGKCGRLQAEEAPFLQQEPRILYLDIETSLISTLEFSLYVPGKFINPALLLKDYFIICWAASWVGEREIYSGAVTGRQAKQGNDKQCLKELWRLMDKADLIAGHNSDRFDIRKIQTRFFMNNYDKPRQFKTIDTLKIVKKHFSFLSNKLEFLSLRMGFDPKDDMELDDWIKICVDGDEQRIAKMQKYNIGDVRNGKKVLEKLLPWVHPYPSQPRGGYKVMKEKRDIVKH